MRALRVLIADDHEAVRQGVRSLLEKRPGWEVCGEAVDGQDAVEKTNSLRPDVAILDVRMPNVGGLEAAALIQKDLPETKIVILSQHDLVQMRDIALKAGASAFVSKYDIHRDLVPAIEQLMNREGPNDSRGPGPELQPSQNGENVARDFDVFAGGGEMGTLMGSMDWSKTPIGQATTWSPTLRMLVRLLLVNRFQLFLWWGPSFCQIYNDASHPILGKKHPKSMGQPASECWAEIWHIIGPLIETPYGGGDPTWMDDIFLEMNRLRLHGRNALYHRLQPCSGFKRAKWNWWSARDCA